MARYGSPLACFGLFDNSVAQASIAVQCIQIVFLAFILTNWAVAQRKTPHQFEVLKWRNFGLAMVYAIFGFIEFFLLGCSLDFTLADSYRLSIVAHILHWIALALTLAAVLLAVPSGFDRLRDPTTALTTRSTWTLASRLLLGLFTLFTIVYLCLFVWAYQSAIDTYNSDRWSSYSTTSLSAFPQYIYVYMALTTTWFVLLLATAIKSIQGLRHAAASWRVSRALKAWTWALALALFAWGALMTFFAFWDALGVYVWPYSSSYLAQNVCELVLITFFMLLALLAVVQVAKGVSAMLAHPDLYAVRRKENGTGRDVEADAQVVHGGVVH
ncbi:RTA-like protein [Macrophomina phaseolina MS6]|uniref:RTA-like protein n=1 Tax=Macrophomina phaseolina (strain MS6) TaxID=1126212 RepID=K2R8Q6_MACPH|nr:RTA-like protein [Macrophomina phaseolina MS6]